MKKVLFIAFYFNQKNEIASKRLRGISKYLPQFGWKPIVIVPKINNIPFEKLKGVKIIETDYTDMLDKWVKKNNENIFENKNEINENSFKNKVFSKAISIAGEVFAYPDGMKYWYKPAIKASKEIIESEKIDGIISSSWPITSHIIAHDLKSKYNIPWIADLRDLWNLNPYINHIFIRDYFEKKLEISTFKNADALTTTTNLAKETLKTIHPNKKIKAIVSGYDPDDFKDIKTIKKSYKLTITYAGSLYGGKRDPTLLFKALEELNKEHKIDISKILINFYGDNYNLDKLIKEYSLEDVVKINGKLPYEEVLKKQKSSDILLLISWMNPKEKMFIPGKVYEYMASKKPVLSIGYPEGSLKNLIEDTNIGHHCSTLSEVKNVLYEYYEEYSKNKNIKYLANKKIKDYSMIKTAENFKNLLEEIKL